MPITSQKFAVANWKSQKTLEEALHWLDAVGPATTHSGLTIALCPPFPFLVPLQLMVAQKGYRIALGVQDLSPFPAGAYTGAVSVRNLENLKVTYVILGHSERRKYFHESHQEVANKVALAVEAGITPILCVDTQDVWPQSSALENGLAKKCIIAFEPAGNIGAGEVDPLEDVLAVAQNIRKAFATPKGVLYGGSVDEKTAKPFLTSPELAGVLVGGASLDAGQFSTMLKTY